MATANPFRSQSLRRKPLACLAASLFAAASLLEPIQAQTVADTSWIRFRSDPARRLFAQLPAPRSASPARPAATLPVTSCADDGPGSLRAVIATAGDSDTVDLSALSCGTITLETGAIPIELDDLTLQGPGRDALAIDGNHLDRVFLHYGGGTLVLQGLTISGGRNRATGFDVAGGGCIASAGYLNLADTTVTNCYAGGEGSYGGAVYAYSLMMSNSTISDNLAYGVHESAGTAAFGGGAFVYAIQLTDSTISGNRADHRFRDGRTSYDIGGGVITVSGGSIYNSTIDSNFSNGRGGGIAAFNSILVSSSTFSGNIAATEFGGGLFLRWPSTLQLDNSTVTRNSAVGDSGGIWLNAPGSYFQSSIVFGNISDVGNLGSPQSPPFAVTVGGGNNLIGHIGTMLTLPFDTLHADPRFAPLAYNGGPTRTHALLRGSAAVDAGDNAAGLAFDQRGAEFPRVFGAAPDIGAFEQQGVPPAPVQAPVPALSRWITALLAGLLAGIAGSRISGRTRRIAETRPQV